MTEKVNPSVNRPAEVFKTSGAIALAGGSKHGWISSSSNISDISVDDQNIDETQLNEFSATTSSSSLDVTIDGGEAFVYGSWMAKDTASTLTLSSSTNNQTVYAGWDMSATDGVIIGLDSAFDSTNEIDQKIPLYSFDTDGSGVTNTDDLREIGIYQDVSHIEVDDQLDAPIYAELSNAPSKEGSVVIIDGSGSDIEGVYRYDGSSYQYIGNTDEKIEDVVASLIVGGDKVSTSYDDSNDTLTVNTSALDVEEVEDQVNTLLTGGSNVSVNYDDPNDTLTIDTSALNAEEVEDQVNSLITAGTGITTNYDDANDTLTISGFDRDHSSLTNVLSDQHHTRYSDEEAQDAVGTITSGGDNVSVTYDDANDSLTIDTSALNPEEVEDQVDTLLTGGTGITTNYDDANNTLTITGFDGDHSSLTNVLSDQHHTRYSDEEAQDAVGTITSGGDKVSVTYDDANDSLTIDTSALDTEEVESRIKTVLEAGTNISLTYDDPNDNLTIDATDTNLTNEEVEDIVSGLVDGGTGITTSYDDANDTLTITGFDGDHSSLTNVLSDQHHTRYSDEEAQDAVGTITSGGDKVSVSYDDTNDSLNIDTSALDTEEVEDQVNSLLSSGSNIGLNYDDVNDDLTISLSNSPSVNSVTLSELMEMSSATEPTTPSGDDVALWNSGNSIEAKFSDGSTVTIAQE